MNCIPPSSTSRSGSPLLARPSRRFLQLACTLLPAILASSCNVDIGTNASPSQSVTRRDFAFSHQTGAFTCSQGFSDLMNSVMRDLAQGSPSTTIPNALASAYRAPAVPGSRSPNPLHQPPPASPEAIYNLAVDFVLKKWIDAGKPANGILQGNGWIDASRYARIETANRVNCNSFENRYMTAGLGIPSVGVVSNNSSWPRQWQLKGVGSTHCLTAVLKPDPVSGQWKLGFLPRLDTETISLAGKSYPLAADFTAPLALYWQLSNWNMLGIFGLIHPGNVSSRGLFFAEPYTPAKIPLVLVHGLMSSPQTFASLVNRLQANPDIRKNFQIWYFAYPTGVPWMNSSRSFRTAITKAMEEFAPGSAQSSQMLVVGHSMGGLVTRAALSQYPWLALRDFYRKDRWNASPTRLPDFSNLSPKMLEDVTSTWVYKPLPWPKRIIFMSTPHRGSLMADSWFSLLGQTLITLPQTLVSQVRELVLLDKNLLRFNSGELLGQLNGVSQLSPTAPLILGLDSLSLKPGLPSHTILGDRGCGCCPNCSDGVVAYWSSHFAPAVSEFVAPCDHSSPQNFEAQNEVIRICLLHLNSIPERKKSLMQKSIPTIAIPKTPVPIPLPR